MLLKELKGLLSKEAIEYFGLDKYNDDLLLMGYDGFADVYYKYDLSNGLSVSAELALTTFYEVEYTHHNVHCDRSSSYIDIRTNEDESGKTIGKYDALLICYS